MKPFSLGAFALGLATALVATAAAAETRVYKCTQDGIALYTDLPCKDAALVDIHPGVADPTARERLERAQAALDRSVAQHRRTRISRRRAPGNLPLCDSRTT